MGLELKNVTKKFKTIEGDSILFENLSIKFPKNGLVVIHGESGCGKSTLLQLIGGIDQEYEGNILFNQKNILNMKDYRQLVTCFVYQNYQLVDCLSVKENCCFYCRLKGIKVPDKTFKRMIGLFELEDVIDTKVKDLSGGQKQRIALIRALLCSNPILLCDEPTGALDNENRKKVYDILKRMSKKYLIILVSHDRECIKYSDYHIDFDCLKQNYSWNYQLYSRYPLEKKKVGRLFKEMMKMIYKDKKKVVMMFISQIYMILAITLIISGLYGFNQYYRKQYNEAINNNLVMIQKKNQNPFSNKELRSLKGNYQYHLDMGKIKGISNFQAATINKQLSTNEVYVNNAFIKKNKSNQIHYTINEQEYLFNIKGILNDNYNIPIIYYRSNTLDKNLKLQCLDVSTCLVYLKNKDKIKDYLFHLPKKYKGTSLVYEEYKSYFEMIDFFTKVSLLFILLSFLVASVLMGYIVLSMFYENQKVYAIMLANGYQNKHLNLFILKKVMYIHLIIGFFSCLFSFLFLRGIQYFDLSKKVFGISKLFRTPVFLNNRWMIYGIYMFCYSIQGLLLSLFMFIKMKKIKIYECLREE